MAINRIRQFPELVITRTPALARQDLGVLDSTAVLALTAPLSAQVQNQAVQIVNISGMNISQASQIISISGMNISQASQIISISGSLDNFNSTINSTINSISGDIYDLDLSLTSSIATLFNTTTISASAGSYVVPLSAAGFITISISGSPYKIPYFNI